MKSFLADPVNRLKGYTLLARPPGGFFREKFPAILARTLGTAQAVPGGSRLWRVAPGMERIAEPRLAGSAGNFWTGQKTIFAAGNVLQN